MSVERIFLKATSVAKQVASHDDLSLGGADSVFTPEAVKAFKEMEAAEHEAELLLNELDHELEQLLFCLNYDKDGSMFLCQEATGHYVRLTELRGELHALAERLSGAAKPG